MEQPQHLSALRRAAIAVVACVVLASLPVAASAGPARNVLDPLLARHLRHASATEEWSVLVHGRNIRAVEEATRTAKLRVVRRFRTVGVGVVRATPLGIEALAADPRVTFLEANRPIHFFLDRATRATRVDEVLAGFGFGPRAVRGIDGRGVSIAIVDTGVDGTHPMLQAHGRSKVVRNVKMTCVDDEADLCPLVGPAPGLDWIDVTKAGNDTDTISGGGHGTHVTGIAAGAQVTTSNGTRMHGAAPGASVVGVSVGDTVNVVAGAAGLNWVLEHHRSPCGPTVDQALCPPIRVVSNSWGVTSPGDPFDPRRVIAKIEHALVDAGVNVVWAAGNDGGSGFDETTNADANSPKPGIITVANYDDVDSGARNNVLAPSSSRGERGSPLTYPDVSAPGTNVISSCRPFLPVCRLGSSIDPNYAVLSGTSMAAPHVAGIVALLAQANPKLTPAQIEDILEDTAHAFVFGGPYERDPSNRGDATSFDKGHGLVDAVAAVALARTMRAPAPARECTDEGPLMSDARGDADLVSMGIPGTRDADIDLVGADAAWDGTRVSMRVRFVPGAAVPPSSTVRFSFGYAHTTYTVSAARDLAGGWVSSMTDPNGASMRVPVLGRFDNARNELTLRWTTTAFNAATERPTPRLPVMRRGSFVGPFSVDVVPPFGPGAADHVASACFVQMGAGPHIRPATWSKLPVRFDLTLSKQRPTYQWSPEPATGAVLVGWVGVGPSSVRKDIRVIPPKDGAALRITLTPDAPRGSDFDVYVYAPDGGLAGSSTTSGSDEEVFIEDAAGVYSVVVEAYTAVLSTYRATAALAM
jgi:subtilisin family serine protease